MDITPYIYQVYTLSRITELSTIETPTLLMRRACAGKDYTNVGAMTYSSRVVNNMHLKDQYSKAAILEDLWKLPFLAGATNTADALMVRVTSYHAHEHNPIVT